MATQQDFLKELEDIKNQAASGDLDGAAMRLAQSYGMSPEQARQNLSSIAPPVNTGVTTTAVNNTKMGPGGATTSGANTGSSGMAAPTSANPMATMLGVAGSVLGAALPGPMGAAVNMGLGAAAGALGGTQTETKEYTPKGPGGVAYSPGPTATKVDPIPVQPQLPSSNYSGPSGIRQVDMNAIRARAERDARMQIEALRQQANQGYGRFKSDVESQIEALQLAYDNQYRGIDRDTQMAARDALQRAAMRGFVTDGMSTGAELSARLTGAEMANTTRNNEMAQLQALQKMLAQQGVEYNDIMGNLTQKQQDLILKLIDDYALRDRENNLKEYQLTSDTALRLLGLDTNWQQFQTGLDWDKERFGKEFNQRQSEFDRQYGFQNRSLDEQIAARLAQQQLARDQMSMQDRWWQGDDRWRRDQLAEQLGFNREQLQWQKDSWAGDDAYRRDMMGMQDKWQGWEYELGKDRNSLAREQFSAENTWRQQQQTQGNADRDWAMNQLTAKYMDEADWMLAQLASGNADPELAARGIRNPNDIVNWYKDRGMKLTSEGANLEKLIQYIRQRGGIQNQTGPVNYQDPMSILDPLGLMRRNTTQKPFYFGR